MAVEVRELREGDIQADFCVWTELVGESLGNFFVSINSLANNKDGTVARLFPATGARRDLPSHGTVEAGASSELAGQCTQERGGERVHMRNHRVSRSGLVALLARAQLAETARVATPASDVPRTRAPPTRICTLHFSVLTFHSHVLNYHILHITY